MSAAIKRSGLLLALVGPTGGGKTSHAARLLKHYAGSLRLSISATTRAPRPNEKEGESYFFISRDEFNKRIAAGDFFEYEEIHGNLYGTPRSTVREAIDNGIDLLLDIDIKGALRFKRELPAHVAICFLLPPSPQVLMERLKKRGGVSEAEIGVRLQTARVEYEQLLKDKHSGGLVDYAVVNDHEQETYERLRAVVDAERCRMARYDAAALKTICVI